jgi:hypothetical protein
MNNFKLDPMMLTPDLDSGLSFLAASCECSGDSGAGAGGLCLCGDQNGSGKGKLS